MTSKPSDSGRGQGRLALERDPVFDRPGFIISPGNVEALKAVEGWRRWPDPRLVLVGPAESGKSHLAAIWARAAGARVVRGSLDLPSDASTPVLVEDADRQPAGEAMFHLLNTAEAGHAVMMTARRPPREWATELPDLRSRLNALRVVELAAPDDSVLLGLLEKFFRERNIRLDADVLLFLARRIERSADAASAVVARIDEAAAAEGREITRAFARRFLEDDGVVGE